MKPIDRNRFEQALVRDAEAALAPPSSSPVLEKLRESYVARYGPDDGELQYERDLARWRKLAEKGRALTAKLDAVNEAKAVRIEEGNRKLAPLERAMNEARANFDRAAEAYEAQRCANQSALVEFEKEAASLMAELNRSAFESRVTQWKYAGEGDAPPREIENRTVVANINWQPAGEGSSGPREFWNTPANGPQRR